MCDSCTQKLSKWQGWIDIPKCEVTGKGPWTDLSYVINPEVPGGPAKPVPRIARLATMPESLFNQTIIEMVTHKGTHVDAPVHYIEDGPSIDQIPLERLYGPGVVWRLDVPPLHSILPSDLKSLRPKLKPGDILILDTGWSTKIGTPDFMRNPSLSPESAEWLVEQGTKMVAVDFRSPDAAQEARWEGWNYPVHRILLSQGVLITECVRNVRPLAGQRVEAAFLALNIEGSDGSPVRAVARPAL